MKFGNPIYTKKKVKEVFEKMGIKKGSTILLQADLSRYSGWIGNYQMLIETLQECIGTTGCLCMPTFSFSCLDPSCMENILYSFDEWKEIRDNLPGYHPLYTQSDVYKDCTNLFLHYKNVFRSNHPVYSFVYWGTFDENVLKVDVNEPFSLKGQLLALNQKNAFNLLVGVDPIDSILIQGLASEYQIGQIVVQRAFIHSKQKLTKSFMMRFVQDELKRDLLEGCDLKKELSFQEPVYLLSKN